MHLLLTVELRSSARTTRSMRQLRCAVVYLPSRSPYRVSQMSTGSGYTGALCTRRGGGPGEAPADPGPRNGWNE